MKLALLTDEQIDMLIIATHQSMHAQPASNEEAALGGAVEALRAAQDVDANERRLPLAS